MKNEINEVYLKVDSVFKLGLKAQIKGSGLSFDRFLHIDDLVQAKNYYLLIINKSGINFNDLDELYAGLIKLIEQELYKIKAEFDDYEHQKQHNLKYDKAIIDESLEELSCRECKLYKIIEQIEKNKTKKKIPTKLKKNV